MWRPHLPKLLSKDEGSDKPRMQFSQKQCILADFLVAMVLWMDFILKWNGKEGMSDVGIAVVTAFGGFATAGYFALSGVRDNSLNKYVYSHPDTEGEKT